MEKHGVEFPVEPSLRRRGRAGLRLRAAVEKTIATLPEVVAVLTGDEDGERRLVTVLAERTDETIGRVARQELALMRDLGGVGFDFWTVPLDRWAAYRTEGYTTVWERPHRADPRAT
jgi:hypothetical protein